MEAMDNENLTRFQDGDSFGLLSNYGDSSVWGDNAEVPNFQLTIYEINRHDRYPKAIETKGFDTMEEAVIWAKMTHESLSFHGLWERVARWQRAGMEDNPVSAIFHVGWGFDRIM